jgi:hypothetical protein
MNEFFFFFQNCPESNWKSSKYNINCRHYTLLSTHQHIFMYVTNHNQHLYIRYIKFHENVPLHCLFLYT